MAKSFSDWVVEKNEELNELYGGSLPKVGSGVEAGLDRAQSKLSMGGLTTQADKTDEFLAQNVLDELVGKLPADKGARFLDLLALRLKSRAQELRQQGKE